MTPEHQQHLMELYNQRLATGDVLAYPDALDLIRVLKTHPVSRDGMPYFERRAEFPFSRKLAQEQPVDFDEFRLAFDWITEKARRAGRKEYILSYYLKHACENAVGHYISNGALIAAGFEAGLKVKTFRNNPNVEFLIVKMPYREPNKN